MLDHYGLDWLCYLAGNSQTAPTIFSYFQHNFLWYLIKNPRTTIALTFLAQNISGIGGATRSQLGEIVSGGEFMFLCNYNFTRYSYICIVIIQVDKCCD